LQVKKNRSGVVAGIMLPMGLICLFAFCSLALALMGGQAYKQIQAGVDDSFGSTVAASYLRTKLSQNNQPGVVSLRTEAGVDMLVIRTEGAQTVYESRIYVSDGRLMESFVPADDPFSDNGIKIAEITSCTFALADDGLFSAEIVSVAGAVTPVSFALTEGGRV